MTENQLSPAQEQPQPPLPVDRQPDAQTQPKVPTPAIARFAATPEVSPGMPNLTPESIQETDAWWGSYSGWTMIPSMVICLGLTALIVWGSWKLLDKSWVQLSILTLTGALWFLQAFRWCYRVFGFNYRVTTHRLFQSKGFLYQDVVEIDLAKIIKVEVQRRPHELLVGVGDLRVSLEGSSQDKVILQGISRPRQVAEQISSLTSQARERLVTAGSVSV